MAPLQDTMKTIIVPSSIVHFLPSINCLPSNGLPPQNPVRILWINNHHPPTSILQWKAIPRRWGSLIAHVGEGAELQYRGGPNQTSTGGGTHSLRPRKFHSNLTFVSPSGGSSWTLPSVTVLPDYPVQSLNCSSPRGEFEGRVYSPEAVIVGPPPRSQIGFGGLKRGVMSRERLRVT